MNEYYAITIVVLRKFYIYIWRERDYQQTAIMVMQYAATCNKTSFIKHENISCMHLLSHTHPAYIFTY